MASLKITFDDKIVAFCQGVNFKSYVRQAINDELFWRDVIARLNLTDAIDAKLTSKLPGQVKSELERILPDMLQTRLNQYMLQHFSAQVAKEINTQMPGYLGNNHQMQQILEAHKTTLNQQLEAAAREILNRVVNEEQYHVTTNAHLAAIDQKGVQALAENNEKATQQRTNIKTAFDGELSAMKTRLDQTMTALTTSLGEMRSLQSELNSTKKKHSKEISNLKWMMGGMFAAFMVAAAVILRK